MSETVAAYLGQVRSESRLTREEEVLVGERARLGHADARHRLVTANLSFVVRVAKEFRNRGVPFEDLLEEGNVGLVEAARRYDPGHGTKFITYAAWWIRKSILQAVAEQPRLVRLSSYRIKRNRESPAGEAQLRTVTISLDEKPSDDAPALVDKLPTRDPSAEDDLLRDEAVRLVREAIDTLGPQERRVVAFRYGLDGGPRLSLQEVGAAIGLSRERIRQIEVRALSRLRRALGARHDAARSSPERTVA